MKKKIFSLLSILILFLSTIPFVTATDADSYLEKGSINQIENNEINENEKVKTHPSKGSADLPTVNIVKPKDKWLYKNNEAKRPLILFSTIILGFITIHAEANASDGKTIEKVDFYIDNEWKLTDIYEPYTYSWIEKPPGIDKEHTIEVVAHDSDGNQNSDKMTVLRYNNYIRPFLVHPIISSSVIIGISSIITGSALLLSLLSNLQPRENTDTEPEEEEDNEPIINNPPSADAKGPYNGNINTPLKFDGSSSKDKDGEIVSYVWNFGDGVTGKGKTITHTYRKEGEYKVRLIVTDDKGDRDDVITKAIVSNSVSNNNEIKDSQKSLEKKYTFSFKIVGTAFALIAIALVAIFIFFKKREKKKL
jgi:hypothetical protein